MLACVGPTLAKSWFKSHNCNYCSNSVGHASSVASTLWVESKSGPGFRLNTTTWWHFYNIEKKNASTLIMSSEYLNENDCLRYFATDGPIKNLMCSSRVMAHRCKHLRALAALATWFFHWQNTYLPLEKYSTLYVVVCRNQCLTVFH